MRKYIFLVALCFSIGGGLAINAQAAENSVELGIHGFVDMSYVTNDTAAVTDDAIATKASTDRASFGMDSAEIDFTGKTGDKASFRIDIDFTETESGVEQGFIAVTPSGKITLTLGKFNAPIGFELLDAPDMYQYSHAMVFDYGLPTNLTGFMGHFNGGIFDIAAYYVNGMDNNTDNNKDKTVGTRVGLSPAEGINLGISFLTGATSDDKDAQGDPVTTTLDKKTITDVDFAIKSVKNLLIGGEYNMGVIESGGGTSKWDGMLVMANYAINDTFALTLRYDTFNDTNGAAFGSGSEEKRSSITVSPSMSIAEGLGLLVEYRSTSSDKEAWVDKDGAGKKSQSVIAAEMTYSF